MSKEYYDAFVKAVEHERTHPRTDEQFVADMVAKHGVELTLAEFKSGLSMATRTNDADMVTYYENLLVIIGGGYMKVTIKDTASLDEKIRKVASVPRRDGFKMIYGWIKSDHIDLGSFMVLIGMIRGDDGNED